jgi:tRNA(fMet)-specific endonuclease VapC
LTAQGRTPSYVDGQIAAIAKTNDLTLVTRNTSDFVHFADLRVENWFAS